MKIIQFILFAAVFAITTQASAQSCYLSSQCDGDELCANKLCAAPVLALETCTAETDCDYQETCDDGFCKPDGVQCSTETGEGVVRMDGGEITCQDGSGTGWATDMECIPDVEGEPCTLPEITDLTDAELDMLYQNCITYLSSSCGEEIPVPEEVCSPEALQTCTDWVIFKEQVLENCEDIWGDVQTENPNPTDTDETIGTPDTDENMEIGGTPDSGSASSGSDDAEVPQISGLFGARGLAATANPWHVADCCEDMDADDGDEQVEMLQTLGACTAGLAPSECDAIRDCMEDVFGEMGYDGGETISDNTDGESKDSDEPTDPVNNSQDDKDGLESDNAGTRAEGGSSSDSGCSISNPGRSIGSLLSLIF